jgi:hypothetical protein
MLRSRAGSVDQFCNPVWDPLPTTSIEKVSLSVAGVSCSTTKTTRVDDSQQGQQDSMTVGGFIPVEGNLYLIAKGILSQSKGNAIELREYTTRHSGERKLGLDPNWDTVCSFPTVTSLARGLK